MGSAGRLGGMIELDVVGIRLAAPEDAPVLLLQEKSGSRVMPIWISPVDAAAIAIALEDDAKPVRPLTHDLVANLLLLAGESEGTVRITDVSEGIFYAVIESGELSLDSRPSDAIAVALRLGWPIHCLDAVMDQVGVEVDEEGTDEVERFKEFLDSVNPDDFEAEGP